jgi:hypothetical protein
VLIGACIYGAYALFGAPDAETQDRTVLVDERRIDGFISEWERRWNRPPTRAELEGVINAFVREDILYRQAFAMGLGEDDPITRRRLAQKLEFLTNDLAMFREPAAGELEATFEENRERYREPDRLTFVHVYFDPDQREDATLDDAAAVLAELEAEGTPDPATLQAGDAFMLRSYFDAVPELDVRRQFGSGFSEPVFQLEPGRWHGPVLSGYGVHLVYVYELNRAPEPVFEDVAQAVLEDWQEAQRETFNAEFIESLMSRYDVEIAELPTERLLEVRKEAAVEAKPEAEAGPSS